MKKIFSIKTFSPLGFLSWAGFLVFFHAICHLAGWREHTAFISGTSEASANLGLVYLVSYFGFVLGAPILILAAGIFAGVLFFINSRRIH